MKVKIVKPSFKSGYHINSIIEVEEDYIEKLKEFNDIEILIEKETEEQNDSDTGSKEPKDTKTGRSKKASKGNS